MEDNRQLAGDRNRDLLAAELLDQPCALGFERLLLQDTVQDHPASLEQVARSSRSAQLEMRPLRSTSPDR